MGRDCRFYKHSQYLPYQNSNTTINLNLKKNSDQYKFNNYANLFNQLVLSVHTCMLSNITYIY